jgi:hypothetical protein
VDTDIRQIARVTRGTHYNYTAGGHRLIRSVLRPPPAEVTALHLGEVTFGLYVEDGVLFLMCRMHVIVGAVGIAGMVVIVRMRRPLAAHVRPSISASA